MSFVYKIHHVPTDDPILSVFLAGKLASLRLQALIVSPSAFGGQAVLEHTARMPYTLWIERLQRTNVHTFVAIAYPEGTPEEEQTVDRGDIVGTAVLIGPVPKSKYQFASVRLEVGEDDEESKWHSTGLYCSPVVRGKGVGKLLVSARIEFAKSESITEKVRIRALVHPNNPKVLEPLKARGFVALGKCTAFEALTANGDGMLIPNDGGASDPESFHTPMGYVMELETTK